MDEGPPDEIVELSEDRWILLVYSRRWPQYVVNWSIRQRSGDSDYPTKAGQLESAPARGGGEEIWAGLRQRALDEAMAIEAATAVERRPRSVFARLFGR